MFASHPQWFATGDEHDEVGAALQQDVQVGCRRQHLLEVVDDEKQPPPLETLDELISGGGVRRVANSQRARDCRNYQLRLCDRRQIDARNLVHEFVSERDCESQSRFAHTASTGERQQPDLSGSQPSQDPGNLGGASDERRWPRKPRPDVPRSASRTLRPCSSPRVELWSAGGFPKGSGLRSTEVQCPDQKP